MAERVQTVGLLQGKPQVDGERLGDGGDPLRVSGLGDDGIEGVKEEMRIDLGPQQPQRIFSQVFGRNHPQGFAGQIEVARKRIEQRLAVGVIRDRVDRKVTAIEVCL